MIGLDGFGVQLWGAGVVEEGFGRFRSHFGGVTGNVFFGWFGEVGVFFELILAKGVCGCSILNLCNF